MQLVNYAGGILLFLMGLYGVLKHRNLLRIALCISLMESATYLLLITIGYRSGATAPIYYGEESASGKILLVDPLMQALTLTSIVVGVITLSMILALIIQLARHYGTLDVTKMRELRG